MTYTVVFTPSAELDLLDIFQFFESEELSDVGASLLCRLESVCEELKTFPERGQYLKELERIGVFQYRQVHCDVYRIIYEFAADEVIIHCVLDGRREMTDLLERRVLR